MPDPLLNGAISISCIECSQPIGTFLLGAIEANDLVAISFADVRRPDGRDIERYIGTQRDLSETRVAEIRQYVTTVDASFPTSVILAISSTDAELDEDHSQLKIRRGANVAKIIDGQHRIAGLKDYSGPPFFVNVTIFLDMDLEDQAMVFATINLKQTKVTKSLAYDLYEFAKHRSPQKTSHNIAKLLNSEDGSPLEGRIKILGKATGRGLELITQATFVDRLLRLITRDAMGDKDRLKRGKQLSRATPQDQRTLIFRNWFIGERDAEIAKCLWNYFDAVRNTWRLAWDTSERGMILARTTGFAALMRLLPHVLGQPLTDDGKVPAIERFRTYFARVPLESEDFTSARFVPGSSGESELVRALRLQRQ
jgi:DGQHR domain-containing protein